MAKALGLSYLSTNFDSIFHRRFATLKSNLNLAFSFPGFSIPVSPNSRFSNSSIIFLISTVFSSKNFMGIGISCNGPRESNFLAPSLLEKKTTSTFAPDSKQYKSRRNLKILPYLRKLHAF